MARICVSVFLLFGGRSFAEKLTVYTYDSLVGKNSIGEIIRRRFDTKKSDRLRFVSFGSAGEALNQAVLEGSKTRADLIVGIDNSLLPRARRSKLFKDFEPSYVGIKHLRVPAARDWIPFDYGFVSFVYDRHRYTPSPGLTLERLVNEVKLKRKVAIVDPRTSSLGKLFLAWTHKQFGGKQFLPFWKGFSSLVLTVSPGWSGAYALFNKHEADMVLSYTTSPAYHLETEKTDRVQALLFPQGHPQQVEGIMVLKGSVQKDLVREFVETILSAGVQQAVPLTQFMYPVSTAVQLPESFKRLPPSPLALTVDIPDDIADWVRLWTQAMS